MRSISLEVGGQLEDHLLLLDEVLTLGLYMHESLVNGFNLTDSFLHMTDLVYYT